MSAVEEKKKMKKRTKAFLAVVGVVLAVALCFGCIYLYLRHEQQKPIFEAPELEPQASLTELPTAPEEAAAYIDRLYAAMTTADDVEGDWHTDVSIGDITTPFASADNALLQYFRGQAPGKIAAFYPSAAEVVMAEVTDAPAFTIDPAKVIEYNGYQGEVTEDNDDSVHYYLNFTMTPDDVDMEAVKAGDVYKQIAETLSPAATIDSFEITPTGETCQTICRASGSKRTIRSRRPSHSATITPRCMRAARPTSNSRTRPWIISISTTIACASMKSSSWRNPTISRRCRWTSWSIPRRPRKITP